MMEKIRIATEYFFDGLRALNEGDLDRAETNFLRALELVPDRSSVLANLSIVYTRQNRLTKALELSQKALRAEPNDPLYLLQQGTVQLKLGDYDGALSSLEAAIKKNPALAEAHNNHGNTLKQLGRLDEALASYDRAISLKPGYAEAYSNRGNTLKELRRLDEALASYDQAISLKPDYAEAYSNRGNTLKELYRLDEALASYDKAIGLNPDYAEAYNNRGNTLKELYRLDEAVASYNKAINLRPDYALAWLGLAQIDSEIGRFAEAEVKYQKARSLDSKLVAPLWGIAAVKKFDSSDPLIAEIEELLSSTSLSNDDRARLHHAYAKICNDLGRYDDAMDNFSIGKRLMNSKFNLERHREWYAAIKRLFTPEFFAERTDFGLQDERPVFMVGMPRSGTTLAEQILASHHLVDGLGELRDLHDIARKWCGDTASLEQYGRSIIKLGPADVKEMAERYLEAYKHSRKQCIRIIDKRPHNYEWLGVIALMFPKAHIVHCQRSPLDNCVSMYMQNFNGSHGYNQDLSVLGQYYREYRHLMDHWLAVLPLPIYNLVYEDIVSDLKGSSRSLVSFLGIDWDPNCLNYHQQDRQINTPSRWQVRQPLYDKSVGRWRRYEKHLDPLKKSLGDQS